MSDPVPVGAWRGEPHLRPGLCLPRAHQLATDAQSTVRGQAPPIVVPAVPADRTTWPTGLRQLVSATGKAGPVADGWDWQVTRAVGPVAREAPRRWVMVESVALRCRNEVRRVGAVAVWIRDVVWLKHRDRHKPKPTEWTCDLVRTWPLTEDGRPADVPRIISSAELKSMIRT